MLKKVVIIETLLNNSSFYLKYSHKLQVYVDMSITL